VGFVRRNIFRFWERPGTWHRFRSGLLKDELDYILGCQDVNGGFANWPGSQTYLETCYYCLVSLGLCGCEKLCRSNIKDFVLSHRCVDGGFTDQPGGRVSNLFNTFYALVCLSMLDMLGAFDKSRTLKFLLSKRRDDGGFSEHIEDPSSVIHAFWALVALDSLGSAHVVNRRGMKEFLMSCQTDSALFGNYAGSRYGYVEYTAYAAILDSVLDLDMKFDTPRLRTEVERRRVRSGYSSHYAGDCNLSDTFWTLYLGRALNLLAKKPARVVMPTGGAWEIFLKLITRLMFNTERAISNKFITYRISPDESRQKYIAVSLADADKGRTSSLEYVGFELYKALPLETKRRLKSNSNSGALLSLGDGFLHLPWEFLLCGSSMLCLSRPLARANRCGAKRRYLDCKCCLLVHDESLISSAYEQKVLGEMLRAAGIAVTTKRFDEFSLRDIKRQYDIIHITGHAENGVLSGSSDSVDVVSLVDHLGDQRFSGLLVCNTCSTGEDILLACKRAEFTILMYTGLLEGRIGYEYVREVYEYLLARNNIAESVRLARVRSFQLTHSGRGGWIGYQLWGNPNLYL
jgi:hypothetical protein